MGIVIGQRIPDVWALGYVGTTALLALTCTQLRDPISWVAAVVASCAHGAAFGLTLKLNVVAATAAAVAVGVRASQAPSLRAGDGR